MEGPESCDWEDSGSLAGEVGARGRGLITGLVVEQNMTLPIVRPNAEDRLGEEQDGNLRIRTNHGGYRITLPMSAENEFRPMDLVQDSRGELLIETLDNVC